MSHSRVRLSISLILVGIALAMSTSSLRTEYQHRAFEQRVELGLWAANAGVWFWDTETGNLTWDARMYELSGMDKNWTPSYEGFLGMLHPEDRERLEVDLQEALGARSRSISQYRLANPEAEPLIVFSGVSADGRYVGGICIPLMGEGHDWLEDGVKNSRAAYRFNAPQHPSLHMIR